MQLHRIYHPKATLLALAFVGCAMASGVNAAEEYRVGTIVPQEQMTMFCQNAAAAQYDVQLEAVSTDMPISREGKLMVLGNIDGADRDAGFDCRFEQNGAFIGIISAPGDGD